MNIEVEYIPIKDIKPYKNNAKQHPREQIEQIKRSIEEFGFADPIGIWHDEIVEGHGRYVAAQELGIDVIPVIRLDELTDEQRRAYALVHNKLTELGPWDWDTLEDELQNIIDLDMSLLGFEDSINNDYGQDIDALFEPAEARQKQEKKIQCPHCGEWFTP